MKDFSDKPLGGKAYGSIPHIIGSRLGEGDHHCEPGQQNILTEKSRDFKDLIIVQEKLDGSNCCIAKINGELFALTRAGYLAGTSPYLQHHIFSEWVIRNKNRFDSLLRDGERIVGEWLYQAHSTRYNLPHEPFVVFDIMIKNDRLTYIEFLNRILRFELISPRLIHIGQPIKLKNILKIIEPSGHGALDLVEGCVFRCERDNKVDFLAKYVRPEKKDGIYLPEISGNKEVYNNFPEF